MSKMSPFSLSKNGDGSFCLVADEFSIYEDKFNAFGRDGGGYDWEDVAQSVLVDKAPELDEKITFDSEASLFCAISDKKKFLQELADLLIATFSDKRRLKRAIRLADEREPDVESNASDFEYVVVIHFAEYLYEKLDLLSDLLIEELEPTHSVESGQMGAGQTNLFLRSNDPSAILKKAKPVLKESKLLSRSLVAFRTHRAAEYSVIWPRNRKKPFSPIMDV